MWARKKPTPNLGDLNTPLVEVKKFYKYWDNFDSWREFSQYDEYDLNDA
jgi:DnaJ family protein C protein 2